MKTKPKIAVRLVHFEGPLKGEVQEFVEESILIGRHPSCHVVFPADQRTIHRKHALIVREGNRYKVISQGVNGTFVNGKRVEEAFLNEGDVLMFAPGGPKLSFFSEATPEQYPKDDLTYQSPQKEPATSADAPPPRSPAVFSAPPEPRPERDDLIQKAQVPLMIQYGPTLKSFKELPISLGKNLGCDYVLNHPAILDRHAQFFFADAQYCLKDLTGKSLISINGVPIHSHAPLKINDRISMSSQGPAFIFLGEGRLAEVDETAS
jgi:pSer/pThr/pTyr-binding forkhead associated (FHA) protein